MSLSSLQRWGSIALLNVSRVLFGSRGCCSRSRDGSEHRAQSSWEPSDDVDDEDGTDDVDIEFNNDDNSNNSSNTCSSKQRQRQVPPSQLQS